MDRLLKGLLLAVLLGLSGCSFQRTDFVCGPDGKPQGELSTSAKTVKAVFPPHLTVNY